MSQSQLKLVLVHEPDSEYAMRLRVHYCTRVNTQRNPTLIKATNQPASFYNTFPKAREKKDDWGVLVAILYSGWLVYKVRWSRLFV